MFGFQMVEIMSLWVMNVMGLKWMVKVMSVDRMIITVFFIIMVIMVGN
jgi:hypothetical protein